MNLFSREEYVERRKILLWFLENLSEDIHNREVDEMIGFVTERLGLSYNDLEIIGLYPHIYVLPEFKTEDEKLLFYFKFLSAMGIERNMSTKEVEICKVIADQLEIEANFAMALISILPQYIRKKIPYNIVKFSLGSIKRSMVAVALFVPLGYLIGTTYA